MHQSPETDRDTKKKLRLAVYIALRPEQFEGGERPADGSAWDIFGERYERNPIRLLDDGLRSMIRLWDLAQGGGGAALYPERSGALGQAAVMLDAFSEMNAAAADVRKLIERKRRRG